MDCQENGNDQTSIRTSSNFIQVNVENAPTKTPTPLPPSGQVYLEGPARGTAGSDGTCTPRFVANWSNSPYKELTMVSDGASSAVCVDGSISPCEVSMVFPGSDYDTRVKPAGGTQTKFYLYGGLPNQQKRLLSTSDTYTCTGVPTPTNTPTPVTYQVTYDGNGNTGGTVPGAQIKIHDTNLTLAANTGRLVKTGYTFSGIWNTNAAGTGVNYSSGISQYTANEAITLYAKWTPEPTSTPTETPTPTPTDTPVPPTATPTPTNTPIPTATPTPIYGVCGTIHNGCDVGTSGWAAEYYVDRWEWWCNGSNALHPGSGNGVGDILCSEKKPTATPTRTPTPTNTPTPTATPTATFTPVPPTPTPIPIYGVCSTIHYDCVVGTSGWAADYYVDRWEWWCVGSNGGSGNGVGDILCSETKPAPPIATPRPPTATSVPPIARPPTATSVPPIARPPTATPRPPTNTPIPPTNTPIPPAATNTSVPPANTLIPTIAPPNDCPDYEKGNANCNAVIDVNDYVCWYNEYVLKVVVPVGGKIGDCRTSNFDSSNEDEGKPSILDYVIWQINFIKSHK